MFLFHSLLPLVWLTQRNCQLTNVVLRAAVRLPTVINVCGRTSHEGYMAYCKLVTAEEPKHAIKASLRAGGTIGERANQSDTLNRSVRRNLAGSIGRKWRDDFSTPVGGPLAVRGATDFRPKSSAGRRRFGPTDHLAFCPRL